MRRTWLWLALLAVVATPPLARAQTQVDPSDDEEQGVPGPRRLPPGAPGPEGQRPEGLGPEGMGPEGGGPERHLEMLDKRLKLTPEQREKVKGVLNETGTQLKALHEKIEKLMRTQNEEIRALLSDEQKPKFDRMNAEMRRHMARPDPRMRPDRRRRPGPPEEEEEGGRRIGRPDDPRDLPPPEMWNDTGGKTPHSGREPQGEDRPSPEPTGGEPQAPEKR